MKGLKVTLIGSFLVVTLTCRSSHIYGRGYRYPGYRSTASSRIYRSVRYGQPEEHSLGGWRERQKAGYSKISLLKQSRSNNSAEREKAAELLKRFSQDPQVQDALAALFGDPDPDVRAEAIKSSLNSEDNYRLQWAIEDLGSLGDSEQILVLGQVACSARDPGVRKKAAESLGKLEDLRRALSVLEIARKREPVPAVRQEIEGAIKEIRKRFLESEKEFLLALLEEGESSVRFSAVRDLGELTHSSAWVIDQLAQSLFDLSPLVRKETARILGEKGVKVPDSVLAKLIRAFGDDNNEEVVYAFGLAIEKVYIARALQLLENKDKKKRIEGVSLMAKMAKDYDSGNPKQKRFYKDRRFRTGTFRNELVERLRQDPAPEVRLEIVKEIDNLVRYGYLEVLPALRETAEWDSSEEVRSKTNEAIERIEKENPESIPSVPDSGPKSEPDGVAPRRNLIARDL